MNNKPTIEVIEKQMAYMRSALEDIAWKDCEYIDFPEDKENPCQCGPCRSRDALSQSSDWRYRGAMDYRVHNGHNPRETRMIMAWKKSVDDIRLAQVLDEGRANSSSPSVPLSSTAKLPSVRDWYVATSVVQWLATNVGMAVLEEAGFVYKKWDEDRK